MFDSTDKRLYEQSSLWEGRFLGDPNELRRFEAIRSLIPTGASSMLDVGAGDASLLSYLEQGGIALNLLGLDRSSAAVCRRRCRAPMILGALEALPFPKRSFDLVTACEVLEHLPFSAFQLAAREISRLSRHWILISVPFRERRLFVRCSHCEATFPQWYHLRTFDRSGIQQLFPEFCEIETRSVPVREEIHVQLWRYVRSVFRYPRGMVSSDICPLCGFQPSARGGSPQPGSAGKATWGSRMRPSSQRDRWLVALFERH